MSKTDALRRMAVRIMGDWPPATREEAAILLAAELAAAGHRIMHWHGVTAEKAVTTGEIQGALDFAAWRLARRQAAREAGWALSDPVRGEHSGRIDLLRRRSRRAVVA